MTTARGDVRAHTGGDLVSALEDLLDFVAEDKFSEFDVEPCTASGDGDLCPNCRSSGCITLKINNARAALAKARSAP